MRIAAIAALLCLCACAKQVTPLESSIGAHNACDLIAEEYRAQCAAK